MPVENMQPFRRGSTCRVDEGEQPQAKGTHATESYTHCHEDRHGRRAWCIVQGQPNRHHTHSKEETHSENQGELHELRVMAQRLLGHVPNTQVKLNCSA